MKTGFLSSTGRSNVTRHRSRWALFVWLSSLVNCHDGGWTDDDPIEYEYLSEGSWANESFGAEN